MGLLSGDDSDDVIVDTFSAHKNTKLVRAIDTETGVVCYWPTHHEGFVAMPLSDTELSLDDIEAMEE
ncbi:hypothetical protein [Haloarchaeobius sp. DYHT-AS-18]